MGGSGVAMGSDVDAGVIVAVGVAVIATAAACVGVGAGVGVRCCRPGHTSAGVAAMKWARWATSAPPGPSYSIARRQ
jgi:hypothetical protein